jgi:ubiquinone/menaquinone biosynthesis C-methylase UbiE
MKATLSDVQAVYSGPEGRLWELIMGEQVHIGGLQSSTALADTADIEPGTRGVDLCCCTGAGMRFLVRFRGVAHMTGVDATPRVVELGRARCDDEGLADRIAFVPSDACASGLPDASVDFVWGEDAWCYVENKALLIAEAARLVRPGGRIAFTDWLEAEALTPDERERFLSFMKFPNMQTLSGYHELLEQNGCEVLHASRTGRFLPYIELYIEMLSKQLTYDALKLIGFDQEMLRQLAAEMAFTRELAAAGKLIQGMIVARKY